jgi:hypothetical protein
MSRRGNCHDNAVAESFFHLLKRERIRRRTYLTREAARQDAFDYIEMFYDPTRKHMNNGMLSPVDYEMKQNKSNEAGVEETMGTSNIQFLRPIVTGFMARSDVLLSSSRKPLSGYGRVLGMRFRA